MSSKPPIIFSPRWWRLAWRIWRDRPRGGNRGTASSDIGGTPWSVEVTRTKNETEGRLRVKW